MTTLITFTNSAGTQRCDAHCHNATHPECTCICGGMNHGCGHEKAVENTREHAIDLCERYGNDALAEAIRQATFLEAAS
ncbi:MAG: hypothetical protein DYG90_00455 [Chloroflexi bacterium CFX6]|nr:hypothetical protein [Chloroflexi bacterium CFX6]